MTQENKKLLLRDLCSRLPYNVIVQCKIIDFNTDERAHDGYPNHIKHPKYVGKGHLFLIDTINDRVQIRPILKELKYEEKVLFEQMCNKGYASIEYCKPYLRPMSSMKEEENVYYNTVFTTLKYWQKEDWLNAHHFDFRNLIEKGLALEAPKDMYQI